MTPRHPHLEHWPKPSRRAYVLGSAAVLAGALIMGGLGYALADPAHPSAPAAAHLAVPSPATTGQLSTLSLVQVRGHKPLGRP